MFIFPSSESDENLYFILTLRDIFPDKNKQKTKKKLLKKFTTHFHLSLTCDFSHA